MDRRRTTTEPLRANSVLWRLTVVLLVSVLLMMAGAPNALAQSPGSALGNDKSGTYEDAQERADEQRDNASPEEQEEADRLDPNRNEDGTYEDAQERADEQRDNASPEEQEEADRLDPNRDEDGTQEEAQDNATEQADNASPEDREAADRVDGDDEGDSGFIGGIAVGAFKAVGGWMMDAAESWAERNSEKMADQFTEGRYQTTTPNNGLVALYEQIADFAKPGAVALLLLLGVSMTLRSANYNTTYAAQYGIPKIVTVLAGMAFFPEIVTMLANLSQSIINAVIDPETLEAGMTDVYKSNIPRMLIGFGPLVWILKFILYLLLILAAIIKNFLFGILFVVGPLAMLLHAVPNFSQVTGAWLRGILACLIIPVLWALEFGIGYRFVADPNLIFGSSTLAEMSSFLLSLAIVYIAWKTPWKVLEWAFYSYTNSGSAGRAIMTAVRLIR